MLLRRVRLEPFRLQLRRPLVTARGSIGLREGFLIEVEDEAGLIGTGEATPYPFAGTEDLETCQHALLKALEALSAVPTPGDAKGLARWLDQQRVLRRGPAARFGIELALLDLIARRRKVPLARLLNGKAATRVPVSALVSQAAPKALAETRRLRRRGFRVFKIKIGMGAPSRDRDRVAAVREAAGPGARLRLDANGAFGGVRAALAALEELRRFRIEFCEEPLARASPALLSRLRRASPIPIAADESLADPKRALALVRARSVDVLVLKPMVLGGLMRALALARSGRRSGMRSVVTTTIDGVVARLGAAHLAAALSPSDLAAGLATGQLLRSDLGKDPSRIERGWLQLPRGAGLGLSPSRRPHP